jgi:hypothetical protein
MLEVKFDIDSRTNPAYKNSANTKTTLICYYLLLVKGKQTVLHGSFYSNI